MTPRFGQSILVNQPAFRGQFQDLFPEFPDKFDPNSVEYTEQSLAATFRKLNHLEPTRTKKSFFLGISGGASLFTSSLEGMTGTLLNGASFQNSTTPFVRISFNFQMGKRRSPRITFVPEIGMSMFKTTGSKTNYGGQYSFEINKTFLEAAIMTKLWLNPAARHKLYLAGGINAYFGHCREK